MSKQEQCISDLVYFDAASMIELYECLRSWQAENHVRFRSLNIHPDGDNFCCIALVNPDVLVQQITKTKEEEEAIARYKGAMTRFQRKALRIIANEKHIGTHVEFITNDIPPEKILEIQSKLNQCTTGEEVRSVFEQNF